MLITDKKNKFLFYKKNYSFRINNAHSLYIEWIKNKAKIKLFFNKSISKSRFQLIIILT